MNTIRNYALGTNINSLMMDREKLKFCLWLHNKDSIRSSVQDIIDKYSFFIFNLFISYLNDKLEKVVKDKQILTIVQNILENNKYPFKKFSIESRRFSVFRKDSIYVDLDESEIGVKNVKQFLKNAGDVIPKPVFRTFIPIKQTLKKFF